MTSYELDPVFVRGLKLLQSRSKESKDQLRLLYEEVVAQRRAEIGAKRGEGDDDSLSSHSSGKKESPDTTKKKEQDKANFEKLKQDLAELSQEAPTKKLKLDPGVSASASSSPRPSDRDRNGTSDRARAAETAKEKPRERLREIQEDIFFGPTSLPASSSNRARERERQEREEREKMAAKQKEKKEVPVIHIPADSGSDTEVSEDAGGGDSDDDVQFELDLNNLSCVVCKSMALTSTNHLLECMECHSLYHQECHKPPVTENVNDPRFVWYCYKCVKSFKKSVVKNQKKPTKPTPPTTARESPVSKPAKVEPTAVLQPFKRLETTKPAVVKESGGSSSSSGSSSSRGLVGLASLAANLNSRASAPSLSTSVSGDAVKSKSEQSTSSMRSVTSSSRLEVSKSLVTVAPEPKHTAPVPLWGSSDRLASLKPSPFSKGDGTKPLKSPAGPPPAVKVTISAQSSSGSSSSGSKTSQSQMMSADKRLQIMKKKAAAKMAEKRTR